MNSIEETLWKYIDGSCTADEQQAVKKRIAADEAYRLKYQELLQLNRELAAMELDEPPMAFTYNVMEAIRMEHAQQPLKATINKRIILGITIFFVTTIFILLVFILASVNLSGTGISDLAPSSLKMPHVSGAVTKPMVEGFLFFDVVLALYLFDSYLRKKRLQKQAQV